jgi:hypothetical protein
MVRRAGARRFAAAISGPAHDPEQWALAPDRIMREARQALGRSQVVRQRILIPPYGGSNPPAPASAGINYH